MGAICCGFGTQYAPSDTNLTPEEIEARRIRAAEAAAARSKNFSQGGGGEKLKAKAKALEEAEKKNKELGGNNALRWQV